MPIQDSRVGRGLRLAAVSCTIVGAAALSTTVGAAAVAAEPTGSAGQPPVASNGAHQGEHATPGNAAGPRRSTPRAAEDRASVHGQVWHDPNKNGIQDDGEPGVALVMVVVTEQSVSKFHRVSTDENGNYRVDGLAPGPIRVETGAVGQFETGGSKFVRYSPKGIGNDPAKDSDVQEVAINVPGRDVVQYNGVAEPLTLAAGDDIDIDAGVFPNLVGTPSPTVTVTGRVWNDSNRNAIQDHGEPGIAGIPVFGFAGPKNVDSARLRRGHEPVRKPGEEPNPGLQVANTGPDGRYTFHGMAEGEVFVAVGAGPFDDSGDPQLVWTFTIPHAGNDRTKDSDVAVRENTRKNFAYADRRAAAPHSTHVFDAGVYRGEPASLGEGGSLPVTGAATGSLLAVGTLFTGVGIMLTFM